MRLLERSAGMEHFPHVFPPCARGFIRDISRSVERLTRPTNPLSSDLMKAQTEKTRAALIHAVIQYDAKQSTKRGYNHYALSQYFARVDDICADLENGADLRKAICAGFLGRLADVCLRAVGLPKTEESDTPRGLCYSPVTEGNG